MANVATVPCQYKTGRTLGQGTYAVVKEAQHVKTGEFYAVKVINKKLMEGREHMVRNEIAVLKKISQGHRNILTLVDYFETYNNLYLVTDYAKGGELFDRICEKMFYNERDAAHIIRSVTEAVAYLHDNGIVHRDLKPENLLFRTKDEDSDLLIADFGLSKIIDSEKFHILTTTCGTPGYMAPEIFRKSGHGQPVDMWAIGVITFFLLCGYTPFDHESHVDETNAILRGDYKFEPVEHWAGITDTAKDFISKLLNIDPDTRMSAHVALNHSWLNDHLPSPMDGPKPDLLHSVRHNFNARRTFKKAVDAVKEFLLFSIPIIIMNEANEVHSMILNIPFPSSRLANIAQKVLKVDKELKTDQVERIITVEEVNLIVKFKCSNLKILRISVNSILDMIIMVIKTMDAFDGTE